MKSIKILAFAAFFTAFSCQDQGAKLSQTEMLLQEFLASASFQKTGVSPTNLDLANAQIGKSPNGVEGIMLSFKEFPAKMLFGSYDNNRNFLLAYTFEISPDDKSNSRTIDEDLRLGRFNGTILIEASNGIALSLQMKNSKLKEDAASARVSGCNSGMMGSELVACTFHKLGEMDTFERIGCITTLGGCLGWAALDCIKDGCK